MRESGEQTPELGGAGRALCGDVARVSLFPVDGRIGLEDVVSACPSPYCSLSYAAVRYQHHKWTGSLSVSGSNSIYNRHRMITLHSPRRWPCSWIRLG